MQEVTNIGLDIAKSVFQVQGVDAEGQVVLRPQLGPVSCHILESCLSAWSICPGRAGPVLASLVPILWETGVGSDVMNPIAAPIVEGMITSTIDVLILVPVFFMMMKVRALRQGKLQSPDEVDV